MGAQVDHGAAACLGGVVEVGRQPPGRAAVVGVPHPGVSDLAQLAAFHQGFGGLQGGPSLVGIGDGKFHAALLDCLGDLLGILVGEGQHLFGEDMFLRFGSCQQHRFVLAGGRGDLHAFNGGILPDGIQVRLEGDAQLLGHSLAPFLVVVPQAGKLPLGVVQNGFCVLVGVDVPRPDDSNLHKLVPPGNKNFRLYHSTPRCKMQG